MAAFTWDDLLKLKFDYLTEKKKTILLKVLGKHKPFTKLHFSIIILRSLITVTWINYLDNFVDLQIFIYLQAPSQF